MTLELKTFRVGILAEIWADYEARMIDPAAPKYQRRDLKQSFLAGVVGYMAAQAAASSTAADSDAFHKMIDELEAETIALARALDDDDAPCDCDVCRAERGDIGEGVRVKTFVKGINAEQAVALSRMISEFIADSGNASPDAAVVARPLH